jgi:hypothetical protein
MDDPVRHEHRVDVVCHPLGVVCQRHRRTSDDEHIGDDAAAGSRSPKAVKARSSS